LTWIDCSGQPDSAPELVVTVQVATVEQKTIHDVISTETLLYAQANASYQDGAVRYRVSLANLQTLTGVLTTP
jgi:hypothetical protein